MRREFIQELRGDGRKEAIDIYDHIDLKERGSTVRNLINTGSLPIARPKGGLFTRPAIIWLASAGRTIMGCDPSRFLKTNWTVVSH